MKNKTLNEEIDRIKSLIGARLINEGISPEIVDIAQKLSKLVGKSLDDSYADDILKLSNAATNEEAFDILAKLANKESSLADLIIPVINRVLDKDLISKIESVKSKLKELKDAGGNVNNIIDDYVNSIKPLPFEQIRPIIKKDIVDFLGGVVRKTPEDLKPVVPSQVAIKLRDLLRKWDEIAPGVISPKDRLLLNDTVFRGLRAKLNYAINNFANNFNVVKDNSLNKIVGLIKTRAQDLGSAETKKLLIQTIDAELESLRKSSSFDKEVLYDVISQEVNAVLGGSRGTDLVNKMREWDKLGNKYPSFTEELLDEKLVKSILDPDKLQKWKRTSMLIIDLFQRALVFITSGRMYNFSEIFDKFIRKYGVVQGSTWLYFYTWALSKYFYPAVKSIWELFVDGFENSSEQENFPGGWKEELMTYYQREVDKAMGVFNAEFIEVFGEKIPILNYEQYMQRLNPFTWMWDDVNNFAEWIGGGGPRDMLSTMWGKVKEVVGSERGIPQNIPNVSRPNPPVIVNPQQPNIGAPSGGDPGAPPGGPPSI
jgi:hypothetical protein